MDKIGVWVIIEFNLGLDVFGSMKVICKWDGKGGYILNGNKMFIINGFYVDIFVFICKLDEFGVEFL